MIGISEEWILLNALPCIVTIWIVFFIKRKQMQSQKKFIINQGDLIKKQGLLIERQRKNLKQSEEILVRQHEAIQDCDKFIVEFIASTKKEIQEKDRVIALLRRKKNPYNN